MYHVQDTLAGYEKVATASTQRAGFAALRRLRIAHPTRDFRLIRDDGTCWTVIA